jgi:hypothetical protein
MFGRALQSRFTVTHDAAPKLYDRRPNYAQNGNTCPELNSNLR